ncbi:MAG: hypothetical protein WB630_12020 [Candidatus Acidiferrales bacterium]
MFLDSGAYSVWTKEKTIDIDEYVRFCLHIKKLAKCPVVFAALDVIPGNLENRYPTKQQIETACQEGWENYQYMLRKDVECVMTFHQGESKHWLRKIVGNSDYICVSPRKIDTSDEEKYAWLKEVFKFVPVDLKVHGLGVASGKFMESFPFYSVDSSAWIQGGKGASYIYFDRNSLEVKAVPRSRWMGDLKNFREANFGYLPRADRTIGDSSTYFYLEQAAKAYEALEKSMTELWQLRKVFWNDEPRIENAMAANPRYAELATYDWGEACGKYETVQLRVRGFEEDADNEAVASND